MEIRVAVHLAWRDPFSVLLQAWPPCLKPPSCSLQTLQPQAFFEPKTMFLATVPDHYLVNNKLRSACSLNRLSGLTNRSGSGS